MAWRPRIHMRIVENEVFEVHKLACDPHGANGIEEMTALGETLTDRGALRSLIQPRQPVLGVNKARQ
jgi:hypothetical protein